jgi:NADPH-dependent ferric siderophore reductase
MRQTRVTNVAPIGADFRLIELEGDALKDISWRPGDKIQVAVGAGFMSRTYTPISWDKVNGRTQILAYLHGEGPGSDWARTTIEGQVCEFLGPRRSLDVSELDSPTLLFGDETSFGLAAAMRKANPEQHLAFAFEVSDLIGSREALRIVGVNNAELLGKDATDQHLNGVLTKLLHQASERARFVLLGKASSIQHATRALKAHGIESRRITAKAYWANGKAGLD